MKYSYVFTQTEWEGLLDECSDEDKTVIIESKKDKIRLEWIPDKWSVTAINSTLSIQGDCHVSVLPGCSVRCYDRCTIEARGDASVVAYDSCCVTAEETVIVRADDSSSVVAKDNVHVIRFSPHTKVTLRGRASVENMWVRK